MTVKQGFVLLCVLAMAACQSGYQTQKERQQRANRQEASASTTAPVRTPIEADSYVVERGDTLYGISFRAGLNFRDVAVWNGIEDPYTIYVGQRLRLLPPGGYGTAIKDDNDSAPVVTAIKPAASATTATGTSSPTEPAATAFSNIDWRWPVKGEIIGRFIAGDKTNQGINIAGKEGQKILSAADGVVVYSGAGLIGYGELLIIKHDNEWISAYAHNSKRLVAEGARVKAGQHIAYMGQTGTVRTMLHFEIRRNGKPVDPLLYLAKP